MIQCVASGVRYVAVVIKMVDTDVLILAIANRHYAQHFNSEGKIILGSGKSIKCYDVNAISVLLGEEICKALPFFHTFSGRDSVSSFSTTENVNYGIDGKNLLTKMHLLKPFPS